MHALPFQNVSSQNDRDLGLNGFKLLLWKVMMKNEGFRKAITQKGEGGCAAGKSTNPGKPEFGQPAKPQCLNPYNP